MNILITQTSAFAASSLIKILYRLESVTIFACDMRPFEMNGANKMVYKFFHTPSIDDIDAYISSINEICTTNRIDIVIPVLDTEIRAFANYREQLCFKVVIPDNSIIETFHDKLKASRSMQELGVIVPPILTDIRGQNKIIFRNRMGIGSEGIYIVDLKKAQYIENHFTSDVFIQEYIDGVEYTVDVLTDKNGKPKMIIPRERMTILHGMSYRCQLMKNEKLIDICKKIYSKHLIPGLSNVQFIVKDGIPYFIELNTRFAAAGIASVLGSYNYLSTFLDHFVNNQEMTTYDDNMATVAWGSIISRYFEETIFL